MAASNALMVAKAEDYPILASAGEVAETIRQNLGGEQVTAADLTRIRVPAGGGLQFTVEGSEETFKAVEGIIVHITRRRAYWSDPNPSGLPPDCVSHDMLIGIGNPGGDCGDDDHPKCPYNQFGSKARPDGKPGRGKACKETKLFFMVRSGQFLPEVIVIPPSSIKPTKHYQLKLGVPYWSVVTRLTLKKAQNKDNIGYAEVACEKVGTLEPAMAQQMRAYAQSLASVFDVAASIVVKDAIDPDPTEV